MLSRKTIAFSIITILLLIFFILDVALGSVCIPLQSVVHTLLGGVDKTSWQYIIINFRIPKALTAVVAGSGIAIAGLHMQTLFRNPLADTSVLGVGHGASLGVALFVLAAALLPNIIPVSMQHSNWGLIIAAIIGAATILLCVSTIAMWLSDMVSILIIGVMFGFITGSLVGVLQYFSNPDLIKSYLIWTMGSLSAVTWSQLRIMAPIVLMAMAVSLLFPKSMNALLLGEQYAQSVGVRVRTLRNGLIGITSVLAGTLTAFIGPIAFVGIAVPHFVRLLFKTADHRVLIPATMLCGALLLLVCDLISQLPGSEITLPINSVTSLIGAPVVVFIVLRNRRNKSTF